MKATARRFALAIAVAGLCLIFQIPLQAQTDWTRHQGNPVLNLGPAGTWDDATLYPGPVLYRDSVFHLWYIGWDGTNPWYYFRGGYASSPDGILWTKSSGSVLDIGAVGSWDREDVEPGSVLYEGSMYKMWYSGYSSSTFNCRIGYAYAPGESTWTKRRLPIFIPDTSGTWDDAAVMWPNVLSAEQSNGYRMWYAGWDGSYLSVAGINRSVNFQIGYATAVDETTWTRHPDSPVLPLGKAGEWDDARVYLPFVIRDSVHNLYHMLYTGCNARTWDPSIGHAYSVDGGTTWAKNPFNPVLQPGTSGSWDERSVTSGGVILIDTTFHLWYSGFNSSNVSRGGYATSPLVVSRYIWVGAVEKETVPVTASLAQNYPNPFNPSTSIRYKLPQQSYVRLIVSNVLGQEVVRLVDAEQAAGERSVLFDALGLPSGMYFYRLEARGEDGMMFVQTRKMVLLR